MILGVFGVLLAGCSSDSATESFELSGVVIDEFDNIRLENVRVIFRSDTLRVSETTTDGDGEYEMVVETDVAFGQVIGQRDGYQPTETTVFFDSPVRRIDLFMRPTPPDGD
ncbi:MAG: hypothetical protein AAGF12_24200 [Myxococcota bacterium]